MSNNGGPEKGWLKHMASILPKMARDVVRGTIGGRGKRAVKKPPAFCGICGKIAKAESDKLKLSLCVACAGMLADGYTAAKCGDKFVFFKSPRLADMAGKIMPVSPGTMAKLWQEFEDNRGQTHPEQSS